MNYPTNEMLKDCIRRMAKVSVDALENPDSDEVEDITVAVDLRHVSATLDIISIFYPSKTTMEKIGKIGGLNIKAQTEYEKNKKNKPKMFKEAENLLNELLICSHIEKITEEAKIYFACIIEVFDEKANTPAPPTTASIRVVPTPVTAPTPVQVALPAPTSVRVAPLSAVTSVAAEPKKRGRPKKVVSSA